MKHVHHGPISRMFIVERLIILSLWLIIQFYVVYFFVFPCYHSSMRRLVSIFTFFWIVVNMIWLHSYVYVSWLDAGSVAAEIAQLRNPNLDLSHLPRCEECGVPNLLRAFHCPRCNRCYIRFDHHCPIVGNCIAYRNTQPFVIYLSYASLILLSVSVISAFASAFSCPLPRVFTGFLCGIIGILSIALMSFAYDTIVELWSEETSIEQLYRSKMRYHRRQAENLVPIWGSQKWKWFVAHPPEINGLEWAGVVSAEQDSFL